MIEFDLAPNLLCATVIGDFVLDDYKAFENHVNYKLHFEGVLDLLFDLRMMTGTTIDVAIAELKFSRQHAYEFGKIAVVTQDQWISWVAWVSNVYADAEMKIFDDIDDARSWLNGFEIG